MGCKLSRNTIIIKKFLPLSESYGMLYKYCSWLPVDSSFNKKSTFLERRCVVSPLFPLAFFFIKPNQTKPDQTNPNPNPNPNPKPPWHGFHVYPNTLLNRGYKKKKHHIILYHPRIGSYDSLNPTPAHAIREKIGKKRAAHRSV
jgi:hypothetical protein